MPETLTNYKAEILYDSGGPVFIYLTAENLAQAELVCNRAFSKIDGYIGAVLTATWTVKCQDRITPLA